MGKVGAVEVRSVEKITKKEKKEILRFVVLLVAIGGILVIMCLILGYFASRLPAGPGGDR